MSTVTPISDSSTARAWKGAPAELWPLSVEQYHAMIDTGILGPDDPVELLDGCLVRKMPKSPEHCAVVEDLRELLTALIGSEWQCAAPGSRRPSG